MRAGVFLATVGLFTLYGYGSAQQQYVKTKLKLVEDHS